MNGNTSKCSSDREPSRMPCPIDLHCKSVILHTVFMFNQTLSQFYHNWQCATIYVDWALLCWTWNIPFIIHYQIVFLSTGCPYKQTTPTPSSNASDKSSSKASEVGDEVAGDFVVGEHVWVNGVKPGVIAYLGETQFSPGQWAGVVLNDLVGKKWWLRQWSALLRVPAFAGHFQQAFQAHTTTHRRRERWAAAERTAAGWCGSIWSACGHATQRSMLNSSVKTGNESGSNMSDSGSVKKGGERRTLRSEIECWWVLEVFHSEYNSLNMYIYQDG